MLEVGSTLYAVRRSPARPHPTYTPDEQHVNQIQKVLCADSNALLPGNMSVRGQNSPCDGRASGNKAPKADARAAAKCRPGEENLLRFVPADAINVRNARRLMPKHSPAAWGQPGGIRGCDGRADQAPACGLPGRQLRRADDDHARRHRSKGSASVARQGRRCHWAARGLRVKRNDLAPVRARASGASGRLGGGSRQYPQGRAHDDW